MALSTMLFGLSLLIAAACLAAGYGAAGLWPGASAVLLPALALCFAGRRAWAWLAPAGLAGLVGLAAAGLLMGAPSLLMMLGATAGLAAWDLRQLPGATAGLAAWDLRQLPGAARAALASATAARWERQHVATLALALGLGLLLAGSGFLFSLRIPFVLLLALILLDLFSLDRLARYLRNRSAGR